MPAQPNSSTYINFKRDSEIWWLIVNKDTSGNVIQNTAKGPYPAPRAEPISIGKIMATVRKTSYSDSDFATERNATNTDPWRDCAAGTAWIGKIATEDTKEGGVNYVLVHYTVYHCEYGWKHVQPQLGYYYLSGGNPVVFADSAGYPYIGCLDNSGAKLASSSDMILKEWPIKREITFGGTIGY